MSANRVAVRYAKAFVEYLDEKNKLEEAQSFEAFCDLVAENAELRAVLDGVTFSVKQKMDVAKAVAEKAGMPESVIRFLNVLADSRRLSVLPELKQAVSRLVDEKRNVQTVVLTTAAEVPESDVQVFSESMGKMLGSQVRVANKIDPSILGGAVAQVGSVVYDGSVRGHLERLRKELVKEN